MEEVFLNIKNLTFAHVFLKKSKLQRQNVAKFRGIPRNHTDFRKTEFRIIPQDFY
jgi:hypothetical protein